MARLNFLAPAIVAGLLLAGCDGGASAVPVHRQTTAQAPAEDGDDAPRRAQARADARDAPVPMVDGKPMWAASRRYTAEEAALRQFKRNGADFRARSLEDYTARARAFIADPPAGSRILTRANGDRVIYDPRGNVFAVATVDGAPRTLFRPDDGPAYWDQVKAREEKRPSRPARRSGDDDDPV